MKEKRWAWIDSTKTIGILLVIMGHGPLLDPECKQFVYSFHMPLFFILSGLLYTPISPIETGKKDWYRLLVPYFLINAFCLLFWLLCSYLPSPPYLWTSIYRRIGAILLGLGYETEHWSPVCTPAWFLIALFLVREIMSCGYRCFSLSYHLGISILSMMGIWLLKKMDFDCLLPIDSALLAVPFFSFGYLMQSFLLKQTQKCREWIYCLIALGVTLILNFVNGRVDMDMTLYGKSLILYYLCGISGSLFLIFLMKAVNLRGGENLCESLLQEHCLLSALI